MRYVVCSVSCAAGAARRVVAWYRSGPRLVAWYRSRRRLLVRPGVGCWFGPGRCMCPSISAKFYDISAFH